MMMKRLKAALPAIVVFCLALLVCIIYNLTVARHYFPLHDSLAYRTLAFHLLDEHCYCWTPHVITVSHGPLWPFLIAGISLIVGSAEFFDRLFLCGLDAGTCVLIYLFARDLFGKRIGLIAGLFACIYPALFIYTGWLYTEALSTFLQTAVCYTVFRIQRDGGGRGLWRWLLCAVLLALLSLSHPNGILVVGLVLAWAALLYWRKLVPRTMLLSAVLGVAVACALIAPWTIRNYVVSHGLVPVASGGGTVLLGAYNDQVLIDRTHLGGWVGPGQAVPQVTVPFTSHVCPAPCEVALENAETVAAIHWVQAHPGDIPLLVFLHVRNFLTPYTHEADMPMDRFPAQRSSMIVRAMSDTIPVVVMLLAALGFVVTLRRYWRELLFGYLVILSTLAEIVVFYGNSRFRSPIEPLLILLGAGALWWLTETGPGTLYSRRSRRLSAVSTEEVSVTRGGSVPTPR
jgi:4-amino-4-deoxy-L-arabinose transferase-like glycosyltransferase